MKKKILNTTAIVLFAFLLQSFCGFYVTTGDSKIFNQASEVIMVRDGIKNTVTMNNDFQGNAKDFAIVIPVPTVLKEKDIKVVKKDIFNYLNKYSEPRLVEYYDESPCGRKYEEESKMMMAESVITSASGKKDKKLGVKVEAKYTVGEYDILILSAKESGGLKTWLLRNNYKIPANANEVLYPYIKSKMKFFVVKVNLEEMKKLGRKELSPIQISFESEKFMLPIRLGMANSKGSQDLIIYAFTKSGRVECTNYRTTKIPTDKNIPTFMKPKFQEFYRDLFTKQYAKNDKNSVFLEYSWDLSSQNYVKCDPCSTYPPTYAELKDAGIFFVDDNNYGGYNGNLFFTRLHVRYDRKHFPMDLQFQETPNRENFQGRYIMQHCVNEDLSNCDYKKQYWTSVLERRENELENLATLTNWNVDKYTDYTDEIKSKLGYPTSKDEEKDKGGIFFFGKGNNNNSKPLIYVLLALFSILLFRNRKIILPRLSVIKSFLF